MTDFFCQVQQAKKNYKMANLIAQLLKNHKDEKI